MEKAGIKTIRGDYNRDIAEKNRFILECKRIFETAKKLLLSLREEVADTKDLDKKPSLRGRLLDNKSSVEKQKEQTKENQKRNPKRETL